MPDEEASRALYGLGAAWEVSEAGGAVTGAGGALIGASRTAIGAAVVRAMVAGDDLPLAVTAVLTRLVLEPPS